MASESPTFVHSQLQGKETAKIDSPMLWSNTSRLTAHRSFVTFGDIDERKGKSLAESLGKYVCILTNEDSLLFRDRHANDYCVRVEMSNS